MQVADLLSRMQLEAKVTASGQEVELAVPVTRSDVLHACDVVEDVAIAYGYNNIPKHVSRASHTFWAHLTFHVTVCWAAGCVRVAVGKLVECELGKRVPSVVIPIKHAMTCLSIPPHPHARVDPHHLHPRPRAAHPAADGAAQAGGGDGGLHRGAHLVGGPQFSSLCIWLQSR